MQRRANVSLVCTEITLNVNQLICPVSLGVTHSENVACIIQEHRPRSSELVLPNETRILMRYYYKFLKPDIVLLDLSTFLKGPVCNI